MLPILKTLFPLTFLWTINCSYYLKQDDLAKINKAKGFPSTATVNKTLQFVPQITVSVISKHTNIFSRRLRLSMPSRRLGRNYSHDRNPVFTPTILYTSTLLVTIKC